MSIDQYEQIIEEEESKALIEAKVFSQANEEFWKFSEDGSELQKIKDIVYGKLQAENEVKLRRPQSCIPHLFKVKYKLPNDSNNIQIPVELKDADIQVN